MRVTALWNKRSRLYDFCAGPDIRWGPHKDTLFRHMRGRVLFVAIGTGLDISHFPPAVAVIGIDISAGMLAKAALRVSPNSKKVRRKCLGMALRSTELHENDVSGAGGQRPVQHWKHNPRKCLV